MKNVKNYTINDFRQLPSMDWELPFDSLVILPTQARHYDEGHILMDYAIVVNEEPVCRIGMLTIGNAICKHYNFSRYLSLQADSRLCHIECLPESGLMHIIAVGCQFAITESGGYSYELLAVPRKE